MDWPNVSFSHQIVLFLIGFFVFITCICDPTDSVTVDFSDEKKNFYKEKVKQMFYHAYNGYLNNAYPLDELRPLTCTENCRMDTWGSFSLTLIDALDTLLIMGNVTEFQRAVDLVLENVQVDANEMCLFLKPIYGCRWITFCSYACWESQWLHAPCWLALFWTFAGPSRKICSKASSAFIQPGNAYGTVNLRYGVNSMRLQYILGNHINVQTGVWTATDAGEKELLNSCKLNFYRIGAGVDSYFEYLAKGGLLFQRPLLMHQFYEYEKAINDHVRKEDWFMWYL
uniref:alpha-1,2-Mannosidase n=1 Tax=Ditylenchus dipsaci TaxID=166011 RepID=A0A915DPG7_9BILA